MQPTPKYQKSETVYPPSEDTFLLLDALEKDFERLQSQIPQNSLICELGVGSGIVSIFFDSLFSSLKRSNYYVGIDLNRDALVNTETNTGLNNKKMILDPIQTNLFGGLRPGFIDVLIFNPPYVLTPDDESMQAQSDPSLQTALSGGIDGRLIIDKVIESINTYTSPNAIFYMVLVKENKVDDVCARMLEIGWRSEKILYRVCGWEGLYVFKFSRG